MVVFIMEYQARGNGFYFGRAERQLRPTVLFSRGHGDAHRLAPDAHAGVIHLIDGAVSPHGLGGRERLRIRVAGRGVHGEQPKAFAIAAIHLGFAAVQPGGVTAPTGTRR